MPHRKYTIAKSPIHGVGVFASCLIDEDSLVDPIKTIHVGHINDYDDLPTVGVVTVGGELYVPVRGFPLWAVNYSDSPNVRADRKGVTALRDIETGEELTISSFMERQDG